MPLFAFFGPLSGARPGGAGLFPSLIGAVALAVVWTRYLKRPVGTVVPVYNLVALTAACVLMIIFGIWDQFYNR